MEMLQREQVTHTIRAKHPILFIEIHATRNEQRMDVRVLTVMKRNVYNFAKEELSGRENSVF